MPVEEHEIAEVYGTLELPSLLLGLQQALAQGCVCTLGAVLQVCEDHIGGPSAAEDIALMLEVLERSARRLRRQPAYQAVAPVTLGATPNTVGATPSTVGATPSTVGTTPSAVAPSPGPNDPHTAATAATYATPAAEGRMVVATGGFTSFLPDRFRLAWPSEGLAAGTSDCGLQEAVQ